MVGLGAGGREAMGRIRTRVRRGGGGGRMRGIGAERREEIMVVRGIGTGIMIVAPEGIGRGERGEIEVIGIGSETLEETRTEKRIGTGEEIMIGDQTGEETTIVTVIVTGEDGVGKGDDCMIIPEYEGNSATGVFGLEVLVTLCGGLFYSVFQGNCCMEIKRTLSIGGGTLGID